MKLIERLQTIEKNMNEEREKGNWNSKFEGMFVTTLKNIAKSKKASMDYEYIYGVSAKEEVENYV